MCHPIKPPGADYQIRANGGLEPTDTTEPCTLPEFVGPPEANARAQFFRYLRRACEADFDRLFASYPDFGRGPV